ncbi:hypothetical protein ACW23B_16275 [Streptomyces albidoflavus]
MSNHSSALLAENATWQALQATALGEVRRRAALVAAEADVEPATVDGAERLAWNDGGGQSAVWYFTADGPRPPADLRPRGLPQPLRRGRLRPSGLPVPRRPGRPGGPGP